MSFSGLALGLLLPRLALSHPSHQLDPSVLDEEIVDFGPEEVEESDPNSRFYDIEIIEAKAGMSYGFYLCPCFRTTVGIKVGSGQVETREFIFSAEAIFRLFQSHNFPGIENAARHMTFGEFEALWKRARIGLGFKGIQIGQDVDRNYSNIFSTGFDLIFNILRSETVRLDLKTGYDYDSASVNQDPSYRNHRFPQTLSLRWRDEGWESDVNVSYVPGSFGESPWDLEQASVLGSASIWRKLFRAGPTRTGIGLNADYRFEPFREFFDLAPHDVKAEVFLNLKWGYDSRD